MSNKKGFLVIWTAVSCVSLLLDYLGVQWWEGSGDELKILIAGTLLFSLLGLGLYFLASGQTNTSRSGTFLGLFMISILVKFSGAIMLLYAFQSKFGAVPKTVMGMFIFTYVLFLVFETWFMMVLGKNV